MTGMRSAAVPAARHGMGARLGVHALLGFVAVVWGGSFVAARILLTPTAVGATALSPTLLATVRFLLASALFVPPLLRAQIGARRIRLRDAPLFLLLGQLGIAVYFWLQYSGVRLTNAGIAAVLVVGLIPLATLVVSGLALHEGRSVARAGALLLGAAGILVVGGQRGLHFRMSGGFLLGAACLVADAGCFAVYSTLVRGLRARYSPLTLTAGMMLAGTLGLLALSVVSDDWRALARLSIGQWLAIVYLAGVCSVLAYFAYNAALAHVEVSRAVVWLYLEPPVALLLGTLLLGEPIAPATVGGGLLIVGGLWLAQWA